MLRPTRLAAAAAGATLLALVLLLVQANAANAATCYDQAGNSHYCECPPGKAGLMCHLSDGCFHNPCHPKATCDTSPVDGHAVCTCPPGFSGADCSIDNDECAAGSPCEHGGTCVNMPGTFRCDCAPGFNGSRCEININECESNPCDNQATCLDKPGGYQCVCTPGYTGSRCELNIDDCADNPCQNGATCKDDVNTFNCLCLAGYWGKRCEFNSTYSYVPTIFGDGAYVESPQLGNGNPWSKCYYSYACWTKFNNEKCDQECNFAECLYDGNDCKSFNARKGQLPEKSSAQCNETSNLFCLRNYANGLCDQECNNPECGWDGLDCEPSFIDSNELPPISTQAQGLLVIRVEPAIAFDTNDESRTDLAKLLRSVSVKTGTVLKAQNYRNIGNGTEIELIADNRKCQFSCYNSTDLIAKFLSALRNRTKDFDKSLSDKLVIGDLWSVPLPKNVDQDATVSSAATIWICVFGSAVMIFGVVMVISVGNNRQKVKEKTVTWFPEGFKPVLTSRNRDPTDRHPRGRGISTLQALGGNFFRGIKRNERSISTNPNGLNSTDIDRCTATPNGGGIYHEPYDQYSQYGTTYNGTDAGSMAHNVEEPMTPTPMPVNPINIEGPHGLTPLMVASMGQPLSKEPLGLVAYGTTGEMKGSANNNVTDLLQRGAQLNLANKVTGETALHLAARHGRVDAARGLLERCDSHDVNAQDATGRTPLHAAIAADSLGVFELLIRCRGTDLNAQTQDGTTPLILATRVGTYSMLEELIQNECDVTKSDANGKTALHWAAATNNVDAIRRLLAVRETNKDAQDLNEETPLFLAAREGAKGAVEILLNHNANKDISDQMDRSPIEIARSRQHYDIVRLLEEHEPPTPRSITSMHHASRSAMPATPSSLTNSLSPVSSLMMSPPATHSLHNLNSPTKLNPPASQISAGKQLHKSQPLTGQVPPPAYDECQTFSWSNSKTSAGAANTTSTHGIPEIYNVPCLKNYMTPSPDSPFSLDHNGVANQQAGVFI